MAIYIFKRILLMIPTLFGIMLVNFVIVQFAPGGPIDQIIEQMSSSSSGVVSTRATGAAGEAGSSSLIDGGNNPASRGLDPELLAELEKQFGFDKPVHERFLLMIGSYITFDFGESYYQDKPVLDMVIERLPVSISLGLWSLLLIYMISIPLGVRKAVNDGTRFDIWTSAALFVGYAIPGFLFAVVLVIVFAGGSYFDWFPLRGLVSNNFEELSIFGKIKDYFWHLALPVTALTIGGFATLTMLTKNSFLEEIGKQFVLTARAKGLTEGRVMYGHVFRNAMLIVIAGFPAALIGILFTGSMLIEVIFSLNGIGLLGFEAVITRDYPIMFGTLFVFTAIGLVLHLIGDITYTLIDPRIDFETRD
ncbi:MAG: microcin C ABC transporter permease YejB [Proteobacteria bacterium]|jgi:microcin C transport system permease protein|nr:microcin C ABC transporter permease YejB [Pseudomonadota bacterium]MDA1301696.1 microcin C ABC transporter permease YejB [Pseudomonadota bacterium]